MTIRQRIKLMEAAGHDKTPVDNLVLRRLLDLAEGRKHEPNPHPNQSPAREEGRQ